MRGGAYRWNDQALAEVQWTQVHQLDGNDLVLNECDFEGYRQHNVRINCQLQGFYEGLEVGL